MITYFIQKFALVHNNEHITKQKFLTNLFQIDYLAVMLFNNTDFLVMFSLCLTVTFVCSNKESPLYYCSVYKAAKFSCQLSTAGQTSARIHVQRPETEKYHKRKRGNFSNMNITVVSNKNLSSFQETILIIRW